MTSGRVAVGKRQGLSALPKLAAQQTDASHPESQVRLSASAGTGKTQVLTARVLRLLLHDVNPESILCLTFTKAGAAEMADRVHERLGAWVTMAGGDLGMDLKNLGEDIGLNRRDDARNLFARVLDARGSGLRIQTIHSFCQTLLAGFPAEAGLPSGFRPIEGREEEQLAGQALATLVEGYGREGRTAALERLRQTSKRRGEEATRAFLKRCAMDPDAMESLPSGDGLGAYVRRSICGLDDVRGTLERVCDDDGFDRVALEGLIALFGSWRKKDGSTYVEGEKSAIRIKNWLALPVAERVDGLPELRTAWLTGGKSWRTSEPPDPEYRHTAERLDLWISTLIDLLAADRIAPTIIDALAVGRDYARAYQDAKRVAGVVDFNDLIRHTVRLLKTPGIGDWIKFKLDQTIDHILVDEAQDTNAAQWDIVKSLADEFFAGAGAKAPRSRTVFVVGDFKQAIFGFQGTDPKQFSKATEHFAQLASGAGQSMLPLSLNDSYRSSQPILDVTNAVIDQLTHSALGLPNPPDRHLSAVHGSGSATLLPPVSSVTDSGDEEESEDGADVLGDSEFEWAKQLAELVKNWTNGGLRLRNQDRDATPGDVMILVRSRGELARLIVSRLYQAGVPVAGIDRLRLNAPIAVQDLLACIRFALQPRDDLSLACILVSPLMNWSQDELYDRIKQRGGDLWPHLRQTMTKDALFVPETLLKMADQATPYQFLESILSGPIQGRQKLITRLGEEARDPVEELLSQALAFETQATPSLQNFLDWFDKGDVDIKRDPAKPENAVRVMTVHGAKGLQAPIVVLADATSDPSFKRKTALDWAIDDAVSVPLFRPRKDDLVGSLAESAQVQDQREMEEHWRLLYVAITRAEEHLFVGGALKSKQKDGMRETCWHVQVEQALRSIGSVKDSEGLMSHRYVEHEESSKAKRSSDQKLESWTNVLPDWATKAAPQESRPPRPLAPSAIEGDDDEARPPPSDAMRKAARRGVLLHSLFERLPSVNGPDRAQAADLWLERSAGVSDEIERRELIASALAVIEHPEFAQVFGPNSLAEVPLAGVVAGRVISGAVDRLLIGETEVLVVDFKTGRFVPAQEAAISRHHKAQMAAYVAVLQGIFPDRKVRAALLYTNGPKLLALSQDTMNAHKPGFTDPQQDLVIAG
jgi:ATP-dependent helicase/nuclease subunit A